MVFTQPDPMDFGDHEGYISLFDGKTLKSWDGNPKFWRVEDGALVGESTPENPSGNNYIVYRDLEAKDFTLKFEVKVEGSGGTGMQYRSRTGIPWLAAISPKVTQGRFVIHILNGQVMAIMVDDDPNSSNNWSGYFGIEIEATTKVSFRNMWVKKFN